MDPGGIEPPSRDDLNDGLYMLIRSFDLNRPAEDRHSAGRSSRLKSHRASTSERFDQPAFCGCGLTGVLHMPRPPLIRQPLQLGR